MPFVCLSRPPQQVEETSLYEDVGNRSEPPRAVAEKPEGQHRGKRNQALSIKFDEIANLCRVGDYHPWDFGKGLPA